MLVYSDKSARKVYYTNVEVPFPDGRLIVSRTDLDGIITHANEAFVGGDEKVDLLQDVGTDQKQIRRIAEHRDAEVLVAPMPQLKQLEPNLLAKDDVAVRIDRAHRQAGRFAVEQPQTLSERCGDRRAHRTGIEHRGDDLAVDDDVDEQLHRQQRRLDRQPITGWKTRGQLADVAAEGRDRWLRARRCRRDGGADRCGRRRLLRRARQQRHRRQHARARKT